MIQDLKNQHTICSPDVSRIGKEIKANQLKNILYPKRKFGKEERSFFMRGMKSGPGYIMTRLKIMYFASFASCTLHHDHGMLNKVKVVDFIKIGYSNWKNSGSADKRIQKHKSSKCHQTTIQRLVEIPKITQDASATLKNNLTEKH